MNTKICTKCKFEKTLDNFYFRKDTKDKLTCWCRTCTNTYKKEHLPQTRKAQKLHYKNNPDWHKSQRLKYSYGISFDDYKNILDNQKGVCAICGKEETRLNPKTNKPYMLSVDHNHVTREVRGLLCCKCNPGIGNFQEDINLLQNAIKYLQKYILKGTLCLVLIRM